MAPKKAPVTSARTRQERIKNRGKAPASTPKGRQTTAMQRPFKPGTRSSNTTGQLSLPAAGKSGGSKPPKGTTTPKRGGPVRTPAQLAQERRSAAASRKAGAGVGQRASNATPTTAKGNKPNIVTKGLSKAGSPKGAGAGAVASFIQQLPEEMRRAQTGYYNLSKPNADRYNNLKNALGGVDPSKYFGTKLSGKGPTPAKPKAKPAAKPSMYRNVYKGLGQTEAKREKAYASLQNTRAQRLATAKARTEAKVAARKAQLQAIARSTASSRSSAPGRSTTSARTTSSRPAAKTAAKPAAKTTLRPDTVQGVGPIKSGDTYSRNIKKQPEPGKNFAGSKDMPNAAATYNTKTSYGSRVNSSFSAKSPATKPKASSKKSSAMTQAEILKRRRGF